jgi:hypothetical protein
VRSEPKDVVKRFRLDVTDRIEEGAFAEVHYKTHRIASIMYYELLKRVGRYTNRKCGK